MALVDILETTPSAAQAAGQIRRHLASALNTAEVRLGQVRQLVGQYGRSAISAELGADAADMLTVYTKLKEAIQTGKAVIVEDLP